MSSPVPWKRLKEEKKERVEKTVMFCNKRSRMTCEKGTSCGVYVLTKTYICTYTYTQIIRYYVLSNPMTSSSSLHILLLFPETAFFLVFTYYKHMNT